MRALLTFILQLIYPPKCRGCGTRFDIFRTPHPLPLCPSCLSLWEKAKTAACTDCGGEICRCICMPELLQKAGCAALVKAVAYHPNQKKLPEQLILRCKGTRDRELFHFYAADVQLPLWQALERYGGEQDAVVTYIPRRRRAISEEGVDQGRKLAESIASSLELTVVCALINQGSMAQKTLDHAARQEAANRAIRLRERAADAVGGKTVILVDDITTAGATLAAATRLLLGVGAKQVICCVVGVTQSEGPRKGEV